MKPAARITLATLLGMAVALTAAALRYDLADPEQRKNATGFLVGGALFGFLVGRSADHAK